MLEFIRRYKGFFSIIFVLSVAGLVVSTFGTTGSGAPIGGGGFMGSEVIAQVEGQEVQTRQLVQVLNQEMERMEGFMQTQLKNAESPEQEKMLRRIMMQQVSARNVLQRLIYQNFAYSTALELGIRSSPESVRNLIKEYPQFQKDGRFDPLLYKQTVARPAQFEDGLRKQVAIENLRKAFEFGTRSLSQAEIDDQKWLNRSFIFETVELSAENIETPKKPTDKELEDFKSNADSQARLQAYYNRNISDYKQEEEVRARHILVKEGGKHSISDIAKEIAEGKITFEEAAKKYSEDPSNAGKGGDLGFFSKGMMVPEFEKVAFGMKEAGEISKPVKTQFGEHLIQFVERKEASEKSFDEVKDEIAPATWMEARKEEELKTLLADWAGSSNGPSAAQLKKYKLEWKEAEAWKPSSTFFPPIGDVETHMADFLSLTSDKKFLAKAIPKGNAFVFVRLKKIEDAPLEDAQVLADTKVNQAYEFYFKTRYEDADKAKRIDINEEKLAQIQDAIQQQL
ncbi:hypothetical protein GW916_09610 [bacterium]|nr:hypothetical protein [bacterium]